jgi:hypothetical protein
MRIFPMLVGSRGRADLDPDVRAHIYVGFIEAVG